MTIKPLACAIAVIGSISLLAGCGGSNNGSSNIIPAPPNCTGGAPAQAIVTGISPSNGPAAGGTLVTISGSGLFNCTQTATVKFGATAATSVNLVSDSSLTCVAPPGTGTVDVTVTVINGAAAPPSAISAAGHYTYH